MAQDTAGRAVQAGYSGAGSSQMAAYAGFGKRLVALLIDSFVTTIAGFVLGFILGFLVGMVAGEGAEGVASIVGALAQIVVTWLYFAMMESSERQGTLGKGIMNIRVTDTQGNRISFGRATGRYFAKILSGLILMIGYIMAAFTEKKQALHDMIAGTLVVDSR
jgi:uncharacterized RDD family membrane protein YckC